MYYKRRYYCGFVNTFVGKMEEFKVGQTFESWDEFKKCIDEFSKATNIQFCTVTSRTVNTANAKVVAGQPKYDEKFKYSYIKLGCKHYGAGRKAGRGIRPNQR